MALLRSPSGPAASTSTLPDDPVAFLRAIVIGIAGGAAAVAVGLPLPWMIGAMLASCAASVAGIDVRVPLTARNAMVLVLGIMLGSRFTPEIFGQVNQWSLTLAGLLPFILVCAVAGIAYLNLFGRRDPATAYFTAMPGGLSEMILVGMAHGGDGRVIALSHGTRIMVIVSILPIVTTWLTVPVAAGYQPSVPIPTIADLGILAVCAVGWPLARRLSLPAAPLVGPMVLSAVVHLVGWTESAPPEPLMAASQIVVGGALGCQFGGTQPASVVRITGQAVGLTLILLVITAASAGLLHAVTAVPFETLLLAYAPGGVAEMSLVALALDADPAFVSTHHVFRIVLIVIFAPLAFAMIRRLQIGGP